MKGFAAMFRREVAIHRMVFPAAAIASLIPFAVPPLRGLARVAASEARVATAFLISAAFVYGLIAYLGATTLPRAIAERRIGFDFARPVSAQAIWAAAFASALALGIGGGLIAWLPTALAERAPFWPDALQDFWQLGLPWPAAAGAAAILLFGAAQALSIGARSRSPVLLADLAAGVLAAACAALAIVRVGFTPVPSTTKIVSDAIIAIAAAAALAAGPIALARGRTDIRTTHRTLSIATWGIGFLGLLAVHAWISWLYLGGPKDLTQVVSAKPAPTGSWTLVGGTARGIYTTFLYDAASRRSVRLPRWASTVSFSASGGEAAWVEGTFEGPAKVWCIRLDGARPEPKVCATSPALVRMATLDPSGRRLAITREDALTILATDTGGIVASARLSPRPGPTEDWSPDSGFFVGDVFRLYRRENVHQGVSRMQVFDLDLRSRRLEETGSIDDLHGFPILSADREGERVAVVEMETRRARLVEGRSGKTIAWLAAEGASRRQLAFLADGRLAMLERAGSLVLRVFSRNGEPIRTIALPDAEQVRVGGEFLPGRVVVGVGFLTDQDIYAVDADSGTTRLVARHLVPAAGSWRLFDPPNQSLAPGAPGTRLFLAADETLVELDPSTGTRSRLLGEREGAEDRGRAGGIRP